MTPTDLIRLLLAAPLLAWLPGWLVWKMEDGRWRVEDGGSRVEGGALSRAERIFFSMFVSLLISAGLATLLAELGSLSLVSLLTGLVLICLGLWWKTGISRYWILDIRYWVSDIETGLQYLISNIQYLIPNIQSLFSPWTAGLLAILALAALLFFRPAEAILVMDDAGVYVIHGLTLARTGGLMARDPLLPSLSPAHAEQLLPFALQESSYIRHEGAFHIWNWWRGLVQPSFFHLPSIWMAVLALVAGARAAIWATPLAGLLAVSGLALLGRRLFGPAVGLAAALLLTLSFPQVWYARYPTSEMFAQAWLPGGLFLLTMFLQRRSRLAAVAAGSAFGQLLLIRIDGWVAALAVVLSFAGWSLKDRDHPQPSVHDGGDRWFLISLGLTLTWAGLHAALFAPAYVMSIVRLLLTPRVGATAILGVVITVLAILIVWHWRGAWTVTRRTVARFKYPTFNIQRANVVTSIWVIGLLVVGGLLWAGSARSVVDMVGIQWLSWYFTPLGLMAALAGLILMVRDGVSRPVQITLLIGLMYAGLYLVEPRVRAVQPWGVRRFVPAVLPVLVLMMAYFAVRFPAPGSARLRWAIRIGLSLILVSALTRSSWPVLAHDEYAGVWNQIEALAGQFEPGSVVLFNPTGVGQAVAQPLTYLYDRPAFVLQTERPDPEMITELLDRWTADGRSVYLAITGLAPWLADLEVGLVPAGDFTLRVPHFERPTTHAPHKLETKIWPMDLYQLVTDGGIEPVGRLEMGSGELPYVPAGFYGRETAPDGTTFRWTDGNGRLRLRVSPQVRRLMLRTSGPPPHLPPVKLTVFIEGTIAGAWEQTSDFAVHTVDVPAMASADGWLHIELRSDRWVPEEAGLGDDDRRLGVVVDWVAVE